MLMTHYHSYHHRHKLLGPRDIDGAEVGTVVNTEHTPSLLFNGIPSNTPGPFSLQNNAGGRVLLQSFVGLVRSIELNSSRLNIQPPA
jgi:hypothetical protein